MKKRLRKTRKRRRRRSERKKTDPKLKWPFLQIHPVNEGRTSIYVCIKRATSRKFSIQYEQIEVMGKFISFCGSFIVIQHRQLFSLFNAIRRHSQWNHIENCVKCMKTPNHKNTIQQQHLSPYQSCKRPLYTAEHWLNTLWAHSTQHSTLATDKDSTRNYSKKKYLCLFNLYFPMLNCEKKK